MSPVALTPVAVTFFRRLPALLVLALACLWVQPALAYPRPDLASNAWQLDIEYTTPRLIAVETPSGTTENYWYLKYTVTNHTRRRQFFTPEFTIASDRGDLLTAGRGVPAYVYAEIARREASPFLVSPIEMVGPLLDGEDYARQSVVIWPAFPADVDQFNVFIEGLSGETQAIRHPLTGNDVRVRRSLMLTYSTPGPAINPGAVRVEPLGEQQVMR